MTEETGATPDPNADAGVTPANASTTSTASTDTAESLEGLRTALNQERTQRRTTDRELREIRAQLATFQDRDKTDLEKAAARAETAEHELTEFRRRDMARSIAAEAGVADLWEALHGDEENMKALAARLAEKIGSAATPSPSDLGAGARGGDVNMTGSKAMSAQIRRAAGRR